MTMNTKIAEVRRHARIYRQYFIQYWKSRLVYRGDFVIGAFSQMVSLAGSLAFLGLLFTQVDAIGGWGFYDMLFLAGVGGAIMNFHHIFLFNIYALGEKYVVGGRLDRFLVRPLNPLFQVYADRVSDDNVSKFLINLALIAYAAPNLSVPLLTVENVLYALPAIASGIMVYAATFLVFATTAFWTGRSDAALWFIFQLSDFRRYPYGIYPIAVKTLLVTLIPIAFATFFPTTFFLQKPGWTTWQAAALIAGPIMYYAAYRFWSYGLSNYSSTGS